jgi:tetratricopeptide (TPR) repeat protein/serine/threonine protein kinase
MAELLSQEEVVFYAALEIDAAEQRAAYLDAACGDQRELRRRVEALLRRYAESAGPLDRLVGGSGAITADLPPEQPGVIIGPYNLLEQIGEGGMGTVWMAQQTEPVRRLVAVKLIKPGMDTRQVLARFEAERQALALMDHPNIAKVLDAGAAPDGRPFFVMELIKGVPITRYCDERHLTPRQRLELFAPVCQAIQHAHQKGVIHRDVKPSNVLIALYDDRPVPKVIDFGIAKATGQQLTERTLQTGFGAVVGTIEYMSPEQASLNNLDIDTRSDVYSLGVLLYELLTGSPPFSRKELEKAGVLEMLRVIREEEPTKPSTKLSTADGLPTLAANRGMEPAKLTRLVRGELDWIVMKALEKDRNRRYETANGFAMDVQRYLSDEPVLACPPSAWYRFRKFARRNRAGLAVAALLLVFAVLLGSGIGWTLRDRAVRQGETERGVTAALAQAETLLAEGDKETDNPERRQATTRLALAALEKAEELQAAGVGTAELAQQVRQVRVAVEAALADSHLLVEVDRIRLAQAAVKEGNYDNALAAPLYAKALGDYGVDLAAPEMAAARVRSSRLREVLLAALEEWSWLTRDKGERQRLGQVLRAAEPDPNAFRARWQAAVRLRDAAALVPLADEPEVQRLPAADLVRLAGILNGVKEPAAAERLLRAAVQRFPGDFWLNQNLGMLLYDQKSPRTEDAVRYLTAALALRSDSPGVHLNLGLALKAKGDWEGAIRCFQAALRIDPNYAEAHHWLGLALAHKAQWHGAIAAFRKALRFNPDYAEAHYNLGTVLLNEGLLDEAIKEYREVIRLKKEDLLPAHFGLGNALMKKGLLEKAIAAYREAIHLNPAEAVAHYNLGLALFDKGRPDEAIAEHREAIRLKKDYVEAHDNLGIALQKKGRVDEAIAEHREAIRLKPDYVLAHSNLGIALANKGKWDEAIAEHQEAIRLQKDRPELHYNLGSALYDRGRLDEAGAAYREAIRLKPDYVWAHDNLGLALQVKGRLDEAISEFREAIRLKKDHANGHHNLGIALANKGKWDEAIAAYREAIRLGMDFAEVHNNLGNALKNKGRLDEASAAYREAIRLKQDYADAHINLGNVLFRKGQFREALEELRHGDELGSRNPHWPHDKAQSNVRRAERMVQLDSRLSDVLRGKDQPKDAGERIAFAELCSTFRKQYGAAARFYSDAFGVEPKLADDPTVRHRYNAGCVAALAGCGQGKDAGKLTEVERARLRRQALDWLRADLAASRQQVDSDPNKAGPRMLMWMQHWQQDADFAGVRGAEALTKLPEAERLEWQKLWADVEALRQRAAERK